MSACSSVSRSHIFAVRHHILTNIFPFSIIDWYFIHSAQVHLLAQMEDRFCSLSSEQLVKNSEKTSYSIVTRAKLRGKNPPDFLREVNNQAQYH